jgi:serine/threonine-protein kinase
VNALRITAFDGGRATFHVATTTRDRVLLTVAFAHGSSPRRLTTGPTRTIELSGRDRYAPSADAGFARPACGTTEYRRVTVATTPGAPGGRRSRTTKVRGPECAPPAVRIVSWNGTAVRVRVTTSSGDPVTVRASFTQKATDGRRVVKTGEAGRSVTVSGRRSYVRTLRAGFAAPACGDADVRTVTVGTSPAAANGSPSRTVTLRLPACGHEEEPPGHESPPAPSPSPEGEEPGGSGDGVVR